PAITRDERVQVRAGDDIVVDRLARRGGEADRVAVLLGQRIGVLERDVALVRLPLDPQLDWLTCFKVQLEVMVPGVPILSPAGEYFLSIGEDLHIARRIEAELVGAAGGG